MENEFHRNLSIPDGRTLGHNPISESIPRYPTFWACTTAGMRACAHTHTEVASPLRLTILKFPELTAQVAFY